MPKNAEKYANIFFHNMSRSLVGSSYLDEKGHMETRYSGQKNAGKSGKLEVMMENCWKIVEKLKKKRKNNGNCCKIREKRKTNKQSLNTIKVPDQTGKTN